MAMTLRVGVAEPHRFRQQRSFDEVWDSFESSVHRLVAKGKAADIVPVFRALASAAADGAFKQKTRRAETPRRHTGAAVGQQRSAAGHSLSVAERKRAAAFLPESTLSAFCRMTGADFSAHGARLAEVDRRRAAAATHRPRQPGEYVVMDAAAKRKAAEFAPESSLDVYRRMKARSFTDDTGNTIEDTDKLKQRKARRANGMPSRTDRDDKAEDAVEHARAMSRLQGKRF